jgi:ubiquinone/menaquinone biosynthesis C-methylase UbiE
MSITPMPEIDTTYESYTDYEEYISTNRPLVQSIDLSNIEAVADLACGAGMFSNLLFERKPSLKICGIDVDQEQIDISTRKFGQRGLLSPDLQSWRASGAGRILLLTGSADDLPFADREIDLVTMGNAIHLMPDKDNFLAEVARVLRPGGAFVFNSVFFVGMYVPGTEALFNEWIKEAVLVLEEINRERAQAGQPPVPRERNKGGRAFAKGLLSEADWRAKVEKAGFTNISSGTRVKPITRTSLKLVAPYRGLATVLMSGYPLEVASVCLSRAADRAFDRLGIEEIPRLWLEVSAMRA